MPLSSNTDIKDFLGTTNNDTTASGYENQEGAMLSTESDEVVKVNGRDGNDEIATGHGNNLAAGDMVGNEWTYVDGKWVYNASAVANTAYALTKAYSDFIMTGRGNDVLLGNGGDDSLLSGSGNDIINAGWGNDKAYSGNGDDIVNLEAGDDYAEAGLGDDIVNGGAGDDVIYGDINGGNLLASSNGNAATFSEQAQSGGWTMVDNNGVSEISQSAETTAGEIYTISFDLAANISGGHASGAVEVLWNGDVVKTVETTSGAYQTFSVDVKSTGSEGALTFRAVEAENAANYNFDGPIISFDKDIEVGGEDVTVKGFAAGQAKLYQVIDGQLNVFDVATKSYVAVGDKPNFKINAVGFNVEDDLIYGVAKSIGTDSLGNTVNTTDIVMLDAAGATYRVGEGYYGDYVGDFDNDGNLWTFHSGLDRVSVVDVDQLDANGNPIITHFKFPTKMFTDRTYDLAFNATDGNFYAVVSPGKNGQHGKVVKIDLSAVPEGGEPTFSELPITGTLYGDEMESGMAKGAYGAVFLDGEGNLYYGLNRGDHDLDNTTGTKGAIFKLNADWDSGQAYAEFMSEAPSTGSNDGAVDPRSADAFADIDADAAVLIREPALTQVDGGNDILRGGDGNDEIHGNEGGDDLSGGNGNDKLFGDQGADNMSAGNGNDWMSGGTGDDKMRGEAGNDEMSGDEGNDYLNGGSGDDTLIGGQGVDKMVGGTGSDVIEGGSGNDHLWGGNWTADNSEDTFVFKGGSGKDYVHDFEADKDIIDLSAFSLDFAAIQAVMSDFGWATVIDMQWLKGARPEDKIILKKVDADQLDSDNFIF